MKKAIVGKIGNILGHKTTKKDSPHPSSKTLSWKELRNDL